MNSIHPKPTPIDRRALVGRHCPRLQHFDSGCPFTVGNGEFAFTADVTGLQTFSDWYDATVPLGTMAQWAWRSQPPPAGRTASDFEWTNFDSYGRPVPYPYTGSQMWFGVKPAYWPLDPVKEEVGAWLEQNPHRLHLGVLGLDLKGNYGQSVQPDDLTGIDQRLDLWSGILHSQFQFSGSMVKVRTACHPTLDLVAVEIASPLLAKGRQLGIRLAFPGANPYASHAKDWLYPELHTTGILAQTENSAQLERQLNDHRHFVRLEWNQARLVTGEPHVFRLTPLPGTNRLSVVLGFVPQSFNRNDAVDGDPSPGANATNDGGIGTGLSPGGARRAGPDSDLASPLRGRGRPRVVSGPGEGPPLTTALPDVETVFAASAAHWADFWQSGGAVELAGSRDPRAGELERRIVLSQYLTAVQCCGSTPPAETGLTCNSWYGKFHLEMHWWHAAHFAFWGRLDRLKRSLQWYQAILPQACATARRQGYAGARWPKQTAPDGLETPCSIGPLLIWQQPHPLLYAEYCWRETPTRATLEEFAAIVEATAEFMASYAYLDPATTTYVLGPPLIPAQENHDPGVVRNPSFELAYWAFGLQLAQTWRERMGLPRHAHWDDVIRRLAPLPVGDEVYLAHEHCPETYVKFNIDHPSMLCAYGMIPGPNVDLSIMAKTLDRVVADWRWSETWGWDYPLAAMTAARLGRPAQAVDLLLMDTSRNRCGVNGHYFQFDGLPLYLPANGGLLAAVAMMVAGWDFGPQTPAPGFPADGTWNVRAEGLRRYL